jgi:hypothetical protein
MTLLGEGPNPPYENLTLSLQNGTIGVSEQRKVLVARGTPSIDIIRLLDWQTWKAPTYAAYSCEILPCVKSYTAEIRNSLLHETLQSEHILPDGGTDHDQRVADLACVDSTKQQHLRNMGYDLETNQRWLPYNVSVYQNWMMENISYRGTCKFMPQDQVNEYCNKSSTIAYTSDYALKDKYAELVPAECV